MVRLSHLSHALLQHKRLRHSTALSKWDKTLTSLGFGNILLMSTLVIVLTDTEAIIGQLYPTVFIAILVGGYLSQKADQT